MGKKKRRINKATTEAIIADNEVFAFLIEIDGNDATVLGAQLIKSLKKLDQLLDAPRLKGHMVTCVIASDFDTAEEQLMAGGDVRDLRAVYALIIMKYGDDRAKLFD